MKIKANPIIGFFSNAFNIFSVVLQSLLPESEEFDAFVDTSVGLFSASGVIFDKKLQLLAKNRYSH